MSFKPAHGFLYRSFCLKNKLTMFISENHCDRPDINADQKHGSFSARFRPHQTNILILEEKIKLPSQSVFTEILSLPKQAETHVSEQGLK